MLAISRGLGVFATTFVSFALVSEVAAQPEAVIEIPSIDVPDSASDGELTFDKPKVCNASKRKGKQRRKRRAAKRLQDFDWCAFVAGKSEKWKEPRRRHRCKRADTRAEKKACRPADEYELIGVAYADVVPASAVLKGTKASLCDGDEALLLLRVKPADNPVPRLVVQARCKSSFPPDPLRAGLNGEFDLPPGIEAAQWIVRNGEVHAAYQKDGKSCTIHWQPDRSRTASYGIGMSDTSCMRAGN